MASIREEANRWIEEDKSKNRFSNIEIKEKTAEFFYRITQNAERAKVKQRQNEFMTVPSSRSGPIISTRYLRLIDPQLGVNCSNSKVLASSRAYAKIEPREGSEDFSKNIMKTIDTDKDCNLKLPSVKINRSASHIRTLDFSFSNDYGDSLALVKDQDLKNINTEKTKNNRATIAQQSNGPRISLSKRVAQHPKVVFNSRLNIKIPSAGPVQPQLIPVSKPYRPLQCLFSQQSNHLTPCSPMRKHTNSNPDIAKSHRFLIATRGAESKTQQKVDNMHREAISPMRILDKSVSVRTPVRVMPSSSGKPSPHCTIERIVNNCA